MEVKGASFGVKTAWVKTALPLKTSSQYEILSISVPQFPYL